MTVGDAEGQAGMPVAISESRGRNLREHGSGASNVTATKGNSHPEHEKLMEAVVGRENMLAAYKRVVANQGAPGVDGMHVEDVWEYCKLNWPRVKVELLEVRYEPQPVLGVEIPKPGGGVRQLGIPTALDRLIQQAMHQVYRSYRYQSLEEFFLKPAHLLHDV